jgi:hypothetical protein
VRAAFQSTKGELLVTLNALENSVIPPVNATERFKRDHLRKIEKKSKERNNGLLE